MKARTRTPKKYPCRESIRGLPFTVRKITDTLWVLDWKDGGCGPMSLAEIHLWVALTQDRQPKVEVLK